MRGNKALRAYGRKAKKTAVVVGGLGRLPLNRVGV